MKEYIKKQFKNGEEYIQVLPMCIPEGYKELTEIVNKSFTLDDINGNLMAELKQPMLPKVLNNASVFNPYVFDFLKDNIEYLESFYEGHKKGLKHFKKTYFKKYPSNSEAKSISDKFNREFKRTIIELNSVFNKSNIGLLGFKNGILAGYSHYESDHLREYKINPKEIETPEALTKEKQKGKQGRKPNVVKEAKEYLQKFELPENKDKFLNFLKEQYQDVKPKIFNQVMTVLFTEGYLKSADNKEYREAFEKALNRDPQSPANFNKQFKVETEDYSNIKNAINDKILKDALV